MYKCFAWALMAILLLVTPAFACEDKNEGGDPGGIYIDFSGEYIQFILLSVREFKLDQRRSDINKFNISLEDDGAEIVVVFIPKLTDAEMEFREKAKQNNPNAIFFRHNPKNEYGESITYFFSKETKKITKKVPRYYEKGWK